MVCCIVLAFFCATSEAAPCGGKAAKALAADAKRATQWNWGWGVTLGAAAVAYGVFTYTTEDENRKVSLGLSAFKSTLGTIKQIILPIHLSGPGPQCAALHRKLLDAKRVEDKRHGWIAHGMGAGLGVASLAFVGVVTEDWGLAARGALFGYVTGEVIIFTSPNRVRSGGFSEDSLVVVPMLTPNTTGLLLGGRF